MQNDTSCLDEIIQEITDMNVISAGNTPNEYNKSNKMQHKKKKIWYSNDCKTLKRRLNQIRKSLDRNPEKQSTRILFYKTQKEYKYLIKYNRRKYEESLTDKLENLYSQDKNEFWKYLKSMKVQTKHNEDLPQLDKLLKHFKMLYIDEQLGSDIDIEEQENENNPNKHKFNSLNRNLTEDEVTKHINSLKNKKSPGNDQITNEMIKCTNKVGIKLLTKLFNTILNSGYFPKKWNHGLLRLIHKGGDSDDENNYRAITLNSCLGKVFCTVLNQRLSPLLEEENIFNKEQAGFRKNHRTTDHIFLLRKIVKSFTSQNKNLYTCFVDFSKAFDSIWRKGLFDKISKIGINGNFLNILKSIYDTTTNSIIYNNDLSETFPSNKGVKQGDTLSTTLFNLFINDLPDIFKFEGNNPIPVGNIKISCLTYADDLIIMSTSPVSLQKCINNLEEYCTKWKLEVNLKKTKIMIFNKQGSLMKKYKFLYKNKILENAREYKYLGFTFSCSGSNKTGINNLLNQAKKAWFAIQQFLTQSKDKKFQTYMHLFDTQVKPIMLYACETWVESLNENINTIQKNNLEKFHISVLKRLLGVHKKSTNIAILLETGRHPITLSAQVQAIKYFLRFPSTKNQSLLNIYYETEKEGPPYNDPFIKYIINKLDNIGMTNVWREQLTENKDFSRDINLIKNVKTRLKDISSQTILSILETNQGKLLFLKQTKITHNLESYLKITNIKYRSAITRLRISSHKLEIEIGRWNKTPRGQRICKNCIMNEVEDENHFLFECQMYKTERKELYNKIASKLNVEISHIPSHDKKVQEIFYSEDLGVLNALGKYITKSLQKRENTICHILENQYIYYQTIT